MHLIRKDGKNLEQNIHDFRICKLFWSCLSHWLKRIIKTRRGAYYYAIDCKRSLRCLKFKYCASRSKTFQHLAPLPWQAKTFRNDPYLKEIVFANNWSDKSSFLDKNIRLWTFNYFWRQTVHKVNGRHSILPISSALKKQMVHRISGYMGHRMYSFWASSWWNTISV